MNDNTRSSLRIGFIGAGRVGTTLSHAMHRGGLNVVAVFSRNPRNVGEVTARLPHILAGRTMQETADASDLVFLTVPDDAIEPTCAGIVWHPGQQVVHCSGATELSALESARNAGASVGAFHPLQMFANPTVALDTLPGCTVTIDAAPPLAELLEDIGARIGCRPLRLNAGERALYHASAYYVGPFLIALMQEAAHIWKALGVSERDALTALVPLLQGTAAAVLDGGLAKGMGGCVARGDVGTIQKHLDALTRFSPVMAALYRELAMRTIPLALARGTLSPGTARTIRAVLEASPVSSGDRATMPGRAE